MLYSPSPAARHCRSPLFSNLYTVVCAFVENENRDPFTYNWNLQISRTQNEISDKQFKNVFQRRGKQHEQQKNWGFLENPFAAFPDAGFDSEVWNVDLGVWHRWNWKLLMFGLSCLPEDYAVESESSLLATSVISDYAHRQLWCFVGRRAVVLVVVSSHEINHTQ